MKSKSYLMLKEQVILCEAPFPCSVCLFAMLMKFSAVVLIDPLMQFKSRVLSRYF